MPRRRRPWQFGLRTLVLMVAVIALLLGWARSQVSTIERALREERAASLALANVLWPESEGGVIEVLLADPLDDDGLPLLFSTFDSCDRQPTAWDWLLDEDLRGTQHVQSITLSSEADALRCLSWAEHFPFLRSLHLRKQQHLDEALSHLRGSQYLEELRLPKTDVTDAGLAHLDRLTRLREVVITDAAVTEAGVAHLLRSPDLDRLVLPGSRVTDEGLAAVLRESNWNLKELNLGRTAVGDATIACLPRHSRLERIRLHRTAAEGRTIEALASLPRLARLAIDGPKLHLRLRHAAALESIDVPEAAELCLEDLPSLEELGGKRNLMEGIKASRVELRDIPKISRLDLVISQSSAFENLASLKTLGLYALEGPTPKVRLSGLPKLESMELWGVDWQDTSEGDWSSMPSLKRLGLSGYSKSPMKPLSPQTLRSLTAASALESLDIAYYEVPDEAAQWLERLPRLKQLTFRGATISPEAVAQLQRALPQCAIDPAYRPFGRCAGVRHWRVDEEE